ncbi:11219_t:CDS:2 [Gigaspora margarita]|uniref:11219_t:CDS:1 n=1 Tax=Gigaspora margarita TaxID=4874 RepID=A0ABN7WHG1_GIGMA|nr:11219_t:CDS:2 [Gigaspora margarita]
MDILDQLTDKSRKKIFNPKTNRMIIINGSAYNKLLHEGYMHWKEEGLLISLSNEMPILRDKETRAWRNDILMKFLHHPNLALSKHRPGALYDAFVEANVLGPEHILAQARILY